MEKKGGWTMLRRCCILFIMLLMLPIAALAQPKTAPYDLNLSICYAQLGTQEQALFDLLYDAAYNGQNDVVLPESTPYDTVSTLLSTLIRDFPELCALDHSWTVQYYADDPEHAVSVVFSYVRPVSDQGRLAAFAHAAAVQAQGDAFARELQLYDALCARVTYADGENAHTAYGALMEGRAVCDGYAGALALLLRMSGIPASVVSGMAYSEKENAWESHAWNIIALDDEYVLADAVWDDQPDGNAHWYLNLTDAQMAADHLPEDTLLLPACCAPQLNWHAHMGGLIPAGAWQDAVRDAFCRLAHGETGISLRFAEAADYHAVMDDLTAVWDAYNASAAPEDRLYGSLRWRFSLLQQCVLFSPGS